MAGALVLLEESYLGSAAVTANRFVKLTAETTVALADTLGMRVHGVALTDIKTSNEFGVNEVTNGKAVGVQILGVAWVETAADLSATAIGTEVSSSATGTVKAAATTETVVGRLLSNGNGSANAGTLVLVQLAGGFGRVFP